MSQRFLDGPLLPLLSWPHSPGDTFSALFSCDSPTPRVIPALLSPAPPPCHWNSMLALKLGFGGISVYSFRRRGSACEVSGPAKPAGEVWWCLRVLTPFVETFRATSPEGPPPGPRPTPSPSRRVSCPQTSSVATHSLAGPFFMKKAHF